MTARAFLPVPAAAAFPPAAGSGACGTDLAPRGPGTPNSGGGGSIPHLERGAERKHLEPFCARPRARPGRSAGILLLQPSAAATPGHGRRPPGAGGAFLSRLVKDEGGRAVPELGGSGGSSGVCQTPAASRQARGCWGLRAGGGAARREGGEQARVPASARLMRRVWSLLGQGGVLKLPPPTISGVWSLCGGFPRGTHFHIVKITGSYFRCN